VTFRSPTFRLQPLGDEIEQHQHAAGLAASPLAQQAQREATVIRAGESIDDLVAVTLKRSTEAAFAALVVYEGPAKGDWPFVRENPMILLRKHYFPPRDLRLSPFCHLNRVQ
jgi:hypothetical protein